MAMDTTTKGLRRTPVLELFNAKRDALRRSYPGPAPASASAAATPAVPALDDDPPAGPGMSLRRMSPSVMKR